jgi:hypothetical protein
MANTDLFNQLEYNKNRLYLKRARNPVFEIKNSGNMKNALMHSDIGYLSAAQGLPLPQVPLTAKSLPFANILPDAPVTELTFQGLPVLESVVPSYRMTTPTEDSLLLQTYPDGTLIHPQISELIYLKQLELEKQHAAMGKRIKRDDEGDEKAKGGGDDDDDDDDGGGDEKQSPVKELVKKFEGSRPPKPVTPVSAKLRFEPDDPDSDLLDNFDAETKYNEDQINDMFAFYNSRLKKSITEKQYEAINILTVSKSKGISLEQAAAIVATHGPQYNRNHTKIADIDKLADAWDKYFNKFEGF